MEDESMKSDKIWIVSQLFYPDETSTGFVMTKIAEQLLTKGEINVICGSVDYQSSALSNKKDLDKRIKIQRVFSPKWNKNNLILRAISFVILTLGMAWKIFFKVKRKDILILVTNPPTLIIVVSIIKRVIGFKLVVILQDIFPENLAVTGIVKKNSFFYRILLQLFNSSYNKADHLVACGEDMKEIFKQKVDLQIPITVITNWADHEEIKPTIINRNEYFGLDLTGKIVIEFAGNIGRVQGLERFFEIFIKVNNPNLFLIIIGDGAFKDILLKLSNSSESNQIHFISSKARSEQNNFLNACDIGLVTLSEGMFGLGVPSKVYNVFAAGKPVLYIGDRNSEIANYIKDHHVGWAFCWEEIEEINSFLANISQADLNLINDKGILAEELVREKFTKSYILNQYNDIFFHK